MNRFKFSQIANEILIYIGWKKPDVVITSDERRTLTNHLKYLRENILLRLPGEFRAKGSKKANPDYEVPKRDFAIVSGLIADSIGSRNMKRKNYNRFCIKVIRDWLAGELDQKLPSEPKKVIELRSAVDRLIKMAEDEDEDDSMTDAPTCQEWRYVLDATIGYETACYELRILEQFKDFKNLAPALDFDNIGYGDMIFDDGSKSSFIMRGGKSHVEVNANKSLKKTIKELSTTTEYLEAIVQIIDMFREAAKKQAFDHIMKQLEIRKCAKVCNPGEIRKARDMSEPDDPSTMASAYLTYEQNIHDYLVRNRDVLQKLSKKSGVSEADILYWFQNRE